MNTFMDILAFFATFKDTLITIVAVVLVLGGLIFFHELGHFCAARLLGIGVSTFSLGFGPKILKHKWGKTEYAISLVPLGGYVALVGEGDGSDIPEGFAQTESFTGRPAWQRLLVIAAGPVFNILLAWFICWGLAFTWGTPILQPVIGGVKPDSPAALAGIKPGDRVEMIDGVKVDSWEALSDTIAASEGRPMELRVQRPAVVEDVENDIRESSAGKSLTITVSAEESKRKTLFGEEEITWLIGIQGAPDAISTQTENFFSAAATGASQTWRMVALTWEGFVKLIQRVVPLEQVGGPIMIAQMVGEQAHQGIEGVLLLAALISINLGILNLLPIPVVDGGQIVFCLYEILFRHPLPVKVQEWATRAGVAILICLMVMATFNDVWRLLK